jgi:signal transduction histidine kinase
MTTTPPQADNHEDQDRELILLVEDSDDAAQMVTTLLEKQGLAVHRCANGEEALAWLVDNTPALILADWMMPKLDGVELCRQIRQDLRLTGVYFLMLTARSGPSNVARALDAGVDGFLTKPVHIGELAARVRVGLRQRRMIEGLIQAEKHKAIATLTGGIAHDYNNMLGSVMANLALLRGSEQPNPALLDEIDDAVLRMARLNDQLLAFSGQGSYRTQPVQLNELVERVISLHHPHRGEWIERSLAPELPPALADPVQLEQVVFQLLQNAFEALEGRRGVIVVRSELVLAATPDLRPTPESPPPWVTLSVEDDGPGLNAEARARLFEPFYTTKQVGRGLGMAAVQGIVAAHEGSVSVRSEEGQGTSVTVVLPAA